MIKRCPNDPRYEIDETKKVFVYKNLHKDCWSIKQGGLVKAHALHLTLYETHFKVNKKGRDKVLREKKKNVHAGICGYISHPHPSYATWDEWDDGEADLLEITYDPYKYRSFVKVANGKPAWFSPYVKMTPSKVLIA